MNGLVTAGIAQNIVVRHITQFEKSQLMAYRTRRSVCINNLFSTVFWLLETFFNGLLCIILLLLSLS